MSDWKTPYSDAVAAGDTELRPANRGHTVLWVPCMNCGTAWDNHYGWRCNRRSADVEPFTQIPQTGRYVTKAMAFSLTDASRTIVLVGLPKLRVERSDLAFFSAAPEGCCACGIPLGSGRCDYH